MPSPHPKEMAARFVYQPETGDLVWRAAGEKHFGDAVAQKKWNTRYAGTKAGYKRKDGRVVVGYNGMKFAAHRVAYCIYYGRWPSGEVDHINGDPSDNRISNLREVDRQENMRNAKRNARNSSGRTGVRQYRNGKWHAYIFVDRKMKHLGFFDDVSDAVEARASAEKELGFHPNHGRAA